MKNNLTSILFLIAINISSSIHSQSESPDTNSKKRLDSHKKISSDYIDQTFKTESDFIKKHSSYRTDRANEKNINLATYLKDNQESMAELQKKLNRCNTNLIYNKDTWHSLNDFIKEYAEINAQYNKDANDIHQEYTNKIEQAHIKRDTAEDQARIKGVNHEISELRDALIKQNDNPECLAQFEEIFDDFKAKRLESLNKFIQSEDQSRKKYLQTKKDLNENWIKATNDARNKKYKEHEKITISHKQNLFKKIFQKN